MRKESGLRIALHGVAIPRVHTDSAEGQTTGVVFVFLGRSTFVATEKSGWHLFEKWLAPF
jgi:hypothetical protein